jgi:hypothetical protein
MLSVWALGLLPPCIDVKAKFVALRPIVGVGAAVTESMTAIDCGVLLAPVAASVTVPAWFPMGSPLILAPTAKDPLLVPEAVAPPFTVSQGTDEVAVQFSVPDPLLVTVTVWLDGEAPF